MLNRLKGASNGRMNFDTGSLSRALTELQKMQEALRKVQAYNAGQHLTNAYKASGQTGEINRLKAEFKATSAALEQLTKQLQKAKAEKEGLSGAARATKAQEISELTWRLKAEQERLKSMKQNISTLENAQSKGFGAYRRQAEELRALMNALTAAGLNVRNFGDAEAQLQRRIEQATRALKAQEDLAKAYDAHNTASTNFNNAWDNMSNAVSTAQTIMQPFKAAVDNAETFEHAMSRVKSLTQSTNIREGRTDRVEKEMAELEAQARQLGATTQFTMTQAAQAQGYLGMAGWTKDQIIKAMPGMLDLAAASGMDLARTADIVSDNLTALGLNASQVGHMTDVYAYALTRSNLNMEALGESMKYAAPAMHAYGGDIHDAAAAMMIMGNAGIKGSMAGTALRMGLLRLAGPPKKASKEMEALGVSLSDATRMAYESQAQLQALGINVDANKTPTEKMAYVLKELSAKMQGLSKDEKLAAVGAIFGVNAASGWLAVLEQGPEKFEEFRNALRASDGTAKQVAQTMNDDTRGAWLYLESAIDAVSNNVGTAFLPALKSIYEGLNPVVTSMAQWIGEHPGVIQAVGAMATAIAGGVLALGSFRLALAGINFVSTTIGMIQATAAMSALSTMTGSVVGVFGRLTAISSAFATSGIAAGFSAIGASLMGAAKAALAFIAAPWQALWGMLTGIAAQFGALLTIIQGQGLLAAIKTIGFAFQGAARSALAFLFSPWGMALAAIGALAAAAYLIYSNWDKVGGYFETIGVRMSAAFSEVSSALSPAFEQVSTAWTQLTATFNDSGLGQVLLAGVLVAIEVVTNVITTVIKLVGDLLSTIGRIGARLMEAFSLLLNGNILGAIGKVREALGEGISGVFDMIRHAVEGVANILRNLGTIAGGFFDGSIMSGKFDWSSLSAVPTKATAGSKASETVKETLKSDRASREEIEVELRNATREGNEERISELTSQMARSNEATLTALTAALTALSEKEVKDVGDKEGFISEITAALKEQATLNADQQSSVINAVSEAIGSRLSTESFTAELRAALSESQTATLSDRDALVQSISAMMTAQSDKDAALTAAIAEIKALNDVSEASKTDMIEQLKAALEKSKAEEKSAVEGVTRSMMPAAKSLEVSSNALRTAAEKLKVARENPAIRSAQSNPELAARMSESVRSLPRVSVEGAPSAVDTSALQESTSALSASINEAALQQTAVTSTFQASTASMSASMVTAGSTVGMSFSNVAMTAQAAGSSVMQLGVSSTGATAGVDGLGVASAGAQAGMSGLGAASSSASVSIGGLGSAASSAISALLSAASSAGSAIAGAISSAASSVASFVGVKHNAIGGIYPRGEFLTTFAEDSAEAAIPIDGSKRAINLWRQTGQMLGCFPSKNTRHTSIGRTSSGSIFNGGSINRLPNVRLPRPTPTFPTVNLPSTTQSETQSDTQSDTQSSESQSEKKTIWQKMWDGYKALREKLGAQSTSIFSTPYGIPNIGLPPALERVIDARMSTRQSETQSTTQSNTLESQLIEHDRLAQITSSESARSMDTSPITLNFTFNGNVNREEVKAGVRDMLPTFEEQMMRFRHEERRRAF